MSIESRCQLLPGPPPPLDLRVAVVARVLASSVAVALFCCSNKYYFFVALVSFVSDVASRIAVALF